MKKDLWKVLLTTLLISAAQASDGISLGEPGYGGSGCPAGSASVTLSPDNTALSIIFDEYRVEVGGMSGRRIDRKNCNIAIPVHVPQGISVSVIQVDYRVFNALPYGAMSRFNVEYFFAGGRGPLASKVFQGPINRDFLIHNELGVQAMVWSACGADANLRVNSSMMVQTNSRFDEAMSTVDSADISAAIIYHLQWKRCY